MAALATPSNPCIPLPPSCCQVSYAFLLLSKTTFCIPPCVLGAPGNWAICKQFGNNLRASYGEPALSAHASAFLSGQKGLAWPSKLEDAAITTVHTFCTHEDTSAFIKPLYTILGDEMKTVVQVRASSVSRQPGHQQGRTPLRVRLPSAGMPRLLIALRCLQLLMQQVRICQQLAAAPLAGLRQGWREGRRCLGGLQLEGGPQGRVGRSAEQAGH